MHQFILITVYKYLNISVKKKEEIKSFTALVAHRTDSLKLGM